VGEVVEVFLPIARIIQAQNFRYVGRNFFISSFVVNFRARSESGFGSGMLSRRHIRCTALPSFFLN
jgi:hypothetical protein